MQKIYTKVVLDMATGAEIEAEFYMYDGLVAQCGGGKGGGPDPWNTFLMEQHTQNQINAQQKVQEVVRKEETAAMQPVQTKSVSESSLAAREDQKQRAGRSKGVKASILTGLNNNTGNGLKTLLGQ